MKLNVALSSIVYHPCRRVCGDRPGVDLLSIYRVTQDTTMLENPAASLKILEIQPKFFL